MRVPVLCSVLLFLVASCAPRCNEFYPYHDDGSQKPHIALVSFHDSSEQDLGWDFMKETENNVRFRLMRSGKVYLPPMKKIEEKTDGKTAKELIGFKDLHAFLRFQPAHFVALVELVEFKSVPYKPGAIKPLYVASVDPREAFVLLMKARLKIVDIRGGAPRIVRQEIIESNHVIDKTDYAESLLVHGKDGFPSSALGLAQKRLIEQLMDKIEKTTCYKVS